MEKKLTKNEKGITLVALIITIIILLILAVISIRAITGDNILGKSETAKNKYIEAKEQEKDTIADYEKNIDGKNNSTSKVEYYTDSTEAFALAIDYEKMEFRVYIKGEDGKFAYANQKEEFKNIEKNTGNSFNIKVNGNTVLIREDAIVLNRGTSIKDYIQDGIYYQDLNENSELENKELLRLNNSIKDLIQE